MSSKVIFKELAINIDHILPLCNEIRASKGEVRVVGGAVRDAILNIKCCDIDLVTTLQPSDILGCFHRSIQKFDYFDENYGKFLITSQNVSFEISTLRKDISCDGRHAKIVFTDDFYLDSMRRDFTINALSYCPFKKQIFDYHDGIKHLNEKCVIFIGNTVERIKEDYLRILRFFRFSIKYANNVDCEGLRYCIQYKTKLSNISRERIKEEFDKILCLDVQCKVLHIMYKYDILKELFCIDKDNISLIQNLHENKLNIAHILLNTKYALLFTECDDINESILLRMKFTKRSAKNIIKQIQYYRDIKCNHVSIIYLMRKIWVHHDDYVQIFLYLYILLPSHRNEIETIYNHLSKISKPVFPVDGIDLLDLNITGKNIGKIKNLLFNKWLNSGFILKRKDLIDLARDMI